MRIKKLFWLFYCCFFLCSLIPARCFCQVPVKSFTPDMFAKEKYAILKRQFRKYKKIPAEYEKQILIALSYFPELQDIYIDFRFKHTNTSFSTRPTVLSVFKRSGRRKYIISISDSSKAIVI